MRIRVVGLGNGMAGDDAAGLLVAERLQAMRLEGVEVAAPGVPDIGMFDGLDRSDLLIVVDAAAGGGEPGTIHQLTPEMLDDGVLRTASSHGFGFTHWLHLAQSLGQCRCRVVIFAIEAGRIADGDTVSEAVAAAVEAAAQRIAAAISERREAVRA